MIPVEINGKTVMLPAEVWLTATDAEIQDIIAKNEGFEIDNPFDTVIDRIGSHRNWEEDLPKTPPIPHELSPEEIQKLNEKDEKD